MYKRTLLSALIFGAAAMAPPAVQAQSNCAPRDSIVERLAQKYSETLTGGGLQSSEVLLEIWSSEKTGSFTILSTHANGISCILASGQNWNSVAGELLAEDKKS